MWVVALALFASCSFPSSLGYIRCAAVTPCCYTHATGFSASAARRHQTSPQWCTQARTHHQGSGKRLPLVLTSAASHVSKWQVQPTLKVGSDTRHLEPSRIFIYSTSLPTSTHVPVQFIRGSRGRSMVSGISLFFFLFNRIEHCGAALPMNGMGFLPTGCSHCQPVTWAKLLPARLIHLSHRMK